jgi:hypothetical protein
MVEALQAIEVPYALVGGMALAFHEVVRATEDADLLIQRSPVEMASLAQQLEFRGLHAALALSWR